MVALRVLEAGSCAPIGGALMDIWHTDACGRYPGFRGQGFDGADTSRETFLRGTQMTDADGLVEFETIYPGWYPGRTAHIHFRAYTEEGSLVSSQLYFPDEVTEVVYAGAPYSLRGDRGTRNGNDGVLRGDMVEDREGWVVELVVGVGG